MDSIYTYVDGLTKKPTKFVFGVRIGVHYVVSGLVDATEKVIQRENILLLPSKIFIKGD